MTLALLIGLVFLAAVLRDTRKRLLTLEGQVNQDTARYYWQEVPEMAPSPTPAPSLEDPEEDLAERPDVHCEEAAEPAIASPDPQDFEHADSMPAVKPARQGFEDLFGRKLPIWAGGFTLLIAASLLVRYSIDAGLLSPVVRVTLAMLFGAALIGGAEVTRRKPVLIPDARIPQALAGAGIGSLYAAVLAAANLYGLIGPAIAFAGLAGVTALAMGLALRFGAPSALLGLVGGLATPALVQSQAPNPPVLAAYVALVVGALTLLSRRQRWSWLGISALVGGAGWSAVMIAMGALDSFSTLCVGGLVLLLGLGLPTLIASDAPRPALLRDVSLLVGAAQLAAIVATGHFSLLTWGLYGLLSIGFLWMVTRIPALRSILLLPQLTALALLAIWPQPAVESFAAVLAGTIAIFGGHALRYLRHHAALPEAASLAIIALAGHGLSCWHFAPSHGALILLALGLAALPACGAALTWASARAPQGQPFAMQAMASAVLAAIAALTAFPAWSAPVSLACVATAALLLAMKAGNRPLSHGALALLGGSIAALATSGAWESEWQRLAYDVGPVATGVALLRWAAVAASATGFALLLAGTRRGIATQGLGALLAYGTLAQLIPAGWLAIVCALMVLALAESLHGKAFDALTAIGTFAALAALWTVHPLALWISAGLISLTGDPVLVTALPSPDAAIRQLLIPVLLIAMALRRHERLRLPAFLPPAMASGLTVLGIIAAHILFKQLFTLKNLADFAHLGLAERTVWQALLIASGAALWALARRPLTGLAVIAAGLAHGLVYTILLHNPLWSMQAVGPWPLINLLMPAYGTILVGLALLVPIMPAYRRPLTRAVDLARILIIPLLACSLLRQLFTGTVLAGHPIGPVETIGWSLLAVGLAIAYLLWGIRQASRDWRIASLVLMLGAVGKVFLLDTSGLEGLLRIGSFLALGFSLIGIGWLYSRYLQPSREG